MKKIIIFITILFLFLFLFSYNNKQVIGIDISHHNTLTTKDWDDLKISFVYIKVSDGASFKDPKRFKFTKIAEERNLKIGFYHFFRDNVSANDQANNYLAAAPYTNGLPFCIDYEASGLHKNIPTKVKYDRLKDLYCLLAHEHTEGVIYCNIEDYPSLKKLIPKATFWVRFYPFETITQVVKKHNGKWLDFDYMSNSSFKKLCNNQLIN